jgi:hypothetical protein
MPEDAEPSQPDQKSYDDDEWPDEQVSPEDLQAWCDLQFDVLEKLRRNRPEALATEIIAQSRDFEDVRRSATDEQRRVIDEAIERLR